MLLISSYADGEATPEEAAHAKAHLEHCGECRQSVEQWRGQRAMFEWAYTAELLEDTKTEWQDAPVGKGKRMSIAERLSIFPIWARRPPTWAWAGALAVAIVAGFAIHYIATLPPFLKIGTQMAAGRASESARMEGDTELKLGPNSKISRIDDRTIRLENGWVNASVPHGSRLRVLTRRMEVLDQGTRFEVGTGPKLDYVIVEEGSVSVSKGKATRRVSAGQVLTAQDEGEPSVASLPDEQPEDENSGASLTRQDSAFAPCDAQSLDWQEGLERLASRFPDLRWSGGTVGGCMESNGIEYRHSISTMIGLKSGLREHFAEIAEALSGGTVDSGDWEIPVALIQVSDVITPELPGDVYYVQLVCRDGEIVWRFTGSMGSQDDYPLMAGQVHWLTSGSGGGGEGVVGRLRYRTYWKYAAGKPTVVDMTIWSADWPVRFWPMLGLRMSGTPIAQSQADRQALLAEVANRVSKTAGLNLKDRYPKLLYLDPERRHRILIAWNDDAGKELCRVSDLAKQGLGGSVTLAALATDVPLEEPKAPAGIYLLRFVLPGASRPPYLEIGAPDLRGAAAWGKSSHALQASMPADSSVGENSWHPDSLPGYGAVKLSFITKGADHNAFPFRFQVVGRPDDRSHTSKLNPTEVWAEGWIRVKKP